MKKKNLLGASVLAMCIMMTACGKSGGSSKMEDGSGLKIMFTVSDANDSFRSTLADAAKKAAEEAGMTIEIKDAAGSSEAQMNQMAGK